MQKHELLERLIQIFEEKEYLNFEQFEVDILKYCKENRKNTKKNINGINDDIDAIYDKNIDTLKKLGYAKFDTKLISDIFPPIDLDLKLNLNESGIEQYDVLFFILDKFDVIKKKYIDASYGIRIASNDIEEDVSFVNDQFIACKNISEGISWMHKGIKQSYKDFRIRIAAAVTALEIFIINVNINKSVSIVKGAIKKRNECPIFIIDEKMVKDFEMFFDEVFKLMYKRQVELRGVLDKDIGYDKKINAIQKSLDRVKYALQYHNEYTDLEYLTQASPKEILEEITKCDFNYLSKEQDSYELFEKFIIFIVETSSKKNKEEQIKDYKKIVKGAENVKEGSSSFYGEQQDILKNYEDIKVGIKIGRNQVLSVAIDVFYFCYALDIEKIRDLLILFFSKAAQIDGRGNTRMATKRQDLTLEYEDQLRYLIKNFLLE